MKIRSIKGRDKEHKKVKDFCDLTALCLYSGVDIEVLKKELKTFVDETTTKKHLGILNKEDRKRITQILNVEESVILDMMNRLRG